MKAIIILKYASEEDIGKKASIRLKNEENEWVEEVVIRPMPEAIPISFIKDKIALNESWGCYGYARCLQSAIDEWENRLE